MIIDHICFAAKNLEDAILYWSDFFGYRQLTEPVTNTRQKVRVVFLSKPNSIPVKLIEPVEDNLSLKKFIAGGGSYHHVCFKCDNLNETAGRLTSKGLKMLVSPQPGEAFGNHDIAFFWAKYLSNFELIDTDEKAGLIDPQ